jgi:hypothetical protein
LLASEILDQSIQKEMSFEQYLGDVFINTGEFMERAITEDNFEELFDKWLTMLSVDEWLDYGEEWMKATIQEANRLSENIN